MKTRIKRVIGMVLALCLCLYMVPLQAGANTREEDLTYAPNVEPGDGGVSILAQDPTGSCDSLSGGVLSVTLRGWAYDPDDTSAAVSIYVTAQGEYIGTLKANKQRVDVGNATGAGNYHGFEGTLNVPPHLAGSPYVAVYALDIGGGNIKALTGQVVYITADTKAPAISNVKVTDLDHTGYTVSCTVTDNCVIDRVQFPCWTERNDQDDLPSNWSTSSAFSGTKSGNTYTFRVNVSAHNNESGRYATHIYAYDETGNYSQYVVSVQTVPDPATSVSLNKSSLSFNTLGATQTLTATVLPSTASQSVTWTTSNAAVATVSNGVVTAVGDGTATVTATARAGVSARCTVTVKEVVDPKSVSLNTNSLTFDTLGTTQTLTATVFPADASQSVTWTTSNAAVATVSNGVVTAVGYGSAVVTAAAQAGVTAACSVTVQQPELTAVSVATLPEKTVYTVGDILDPTGLTLKATYKNGTTETITEGFSYSPILLDTAGIQTITVTYDGFSAEFQVTVEAAAIVGTCGADVAWQLDHDGVLTISGSGAMTDYGSKSAMPWYEYFDQITSVVIEEGVTSVGDYAFYGAPALESIAIPDSVTYVGAYAFKNASKIDNVVLPAKLEKLGESAFYACTGLTAIDIPASLYTIQPYTFKNCTALAELTLHEGNLMKISDGAFYNTALTELVLPECLDILDAYSFKNCSKLADITLGSGLTQIREAVFYGAAISTIEIPEGVTVIKPYAFKNCVNLASVDLPGTLVTVDEAAFYACTALKTVDFPNAVTKIGDYAFRKCAALETVNFGSGLTNIGESSFYGCSSIETLEIPDAVTAIQGYAFKSCTGLTSVTLGSGVAAIGDSAFHTCTGLKTIVILAAVKEIGGYCFSGSWNLWQLTFLGDAPAIGSGAFNSISATAYYPGDNATWTSDNMLNYGGSITWKAQ